MGMFKRMSWVSIPRHGSSESFIQIPWDRAMFNVWKLVHAATSCSLHRTTVHLPLERRAPDTFGVASDKTSRDTTRRYLRLVLSWTPSHLIFILTWAVTGGKITHV